MQATDRMPAAACLGTAPRRNLCVVGRTDRLSRTSLAGPFPQGAFGQNLTVATVGLPAVLDEGESLSDFVASCVRDGIAWRRMQEAFLARASVAVERSEREDSGISPQEMLRQMDVRLEAARQRLAAGKPSAGQ